MSDNCLITAFTGKENIFSNKADFYCFYCPNKRDIEKYGNAVETNINMLYSYGSVVIPSPLTLVKDFPAEKAAKAYIKEFGLWWRKFFEVKEGTILKVFGNKQTGISGARKLACCYLKIDSQASLVKLSMDLTNTKVSTFREAYIEGKFLFLTKEQAIKEGVIITPSASDYLTEEYQKKVFKWTILEKARNTKVSVKYDDFIVNYDTGEIDI